jgi:hypothetical protein
MMVIGRHGGGWQVITSGGKVLEQRYGRPADPDHYNNFLDCVRTRAYPTAQVNLAHFACTMVHMANIAHRVGNQTLRFDGKEERFLQNQDANAFLKRVYRPAYEVSEDI